MGRKSPRRSSSKFVAGYSEDNPKNGDVAGVSPATAGRARNSVTWLGVQILRYKPVTMGLGVSHWKTLYTNGLRKGDLNKFRWYMMYTF